MFNKKDLLSINNRFDLHFFVDIIDKFLFVVDIKNSPYNIRKYIVDSINMFKISSDYGIYLKLIPQAHFGLSIDYDEIELPVDAIGDYAFYNIDDARKKKNNLIKAKQICFDF